MEYLFVLVLSIIIKVILVVISPYSSDNHYSLVRIVAALFNIGSLRPFKCLMLKFNTVSDSLYSTYYNNVKDFCERGSVFCKTASCPTVGTLFLWWQDAFS